jgi:hypothetical protein
LRSGASRAVCHFIPPYDEARSNTIMFDVLYDITSKAGRLGN